MYAFSVPRDVTLTTRHGWRRIGAALPEGAGGGLDPARVVLAIHDEDGFAQRALADAAPESSSAAGRPGEAGLRIFGEQVLARWPGFPLRLGRSPEAEADAATAGEHAPLHRQLAGLRERRPARRHFRVALVGGFGFNLGDTMMGATAWRILLPALRAALGSVSASVLMGPLAHPAVAELIGHEAGIDEVCFTSPSLQDFSRFDAYFDFTGLVALPKFHEGPALDWVLWWLGLAPEDVPPSHKRNRLRLPTAAAEWAREQLAARPGPRVLFVWRASTPLRSIPDDVAARLASDLLDAAPDVTLITEQSLDLRHPRLLDLGSVTNSAVRMMALVAQADGLLTIDSLAPHVADAADVPTVMLLNSFPAPRFPFYPNLRSIVPAGMDKLPGWRATKVADERWPGMRDDYGRAWRTVSARACWTMLSDLMAARPERSRRLGIDEGEPHDPGRLALPAAGAAFPRDVVTPFDRWIEAECARLAGVVLGPGRTAVLVGGGDGALALALSGRVAPGGALHVLEPRRLRAQKLAADAQAAGRSCVRMWRTAAGERPDRRTVPAFDPLGEAYPGAWGNLDAGTEIAVTALDDLALTDCHVLLIAAPQEIIPALSGAAGLLLRLGPVVISAPVKDADFVELRRIFERTRYRGYISWTSQVRSHPALLVAVPISSEIKFNMFEAL